MGWNRNGRRNHEREAIRAEGFDPDDPAVATAIYLVRWELSLLFATVTRLAILPQRTRRGQTHDRNLARVAASLVVQGEHPRQAIDCETIQPVAVGVVGDLFCDEGATTRADVQPARWIGSQVVVPRRITCASVIRRDEDDVVRGLQRNSGGKTRARPPA